jgi:hypothetical protein
VLDTAAKDIKDVAVTAAMDVDQSGSDASSTAAAAAGKLVGIAASSGDKVAKQVQEGMGQLKQPASAAAAAFGRTVEEAGRSVVESSRDATRTAADVVNSDTNQTGTGGSGSSSSGVLPLEGMTHKAAKVLQNVISDAAAAAAGGEQVAQQVVGDAQAAGSDVVVGVKAAASRCVGAAADVAKAAGLELKGGTAAQDGEMAGAGGGMKQPRQSDSDDASPALTGGAASGAATGGAASVAAAQVNVEANDTEWPTPAESQALQQVEKDQ